MTDKEKAKAYDEALEKARQLCAYPTTKPFINDLQDLFPELQEPEDERIKKTLINFFSKGAEYDSSTNGIKDRNIIAWLEKQGDKCLVNFDEAEQEKYDFVSGQYIECRASFNEFKEDNSYWLEYIGDDNYIGRSDNILNQKFHITPRQLFTLFTWQHSPKEDSNVNDETNAPTEYGKYVDECLNEASKHFFSNGEDAYSVADLFYAGVRCGKSWLEKQGEQKPTLRERYKNIAESEWFKKTHDGMSVSDDEKVDNVNKVEPKFKVGDWLINPRTSHIIHIKDVLIYDNKGIYELENSSMSIKNVEDNFRLWTIQDTKDGDVLYINNTVSESIMIYKSFNNGLIKKYASYNKFGFEGEHYLTLNDGYIVPATKEQCDLLFRKMKEAGYEWDAEKKELKKINSYCQENCKGFQETGKCFADGECKAKKEAEQKSAWSEDDERMLHTIIADFKGFIRNNTSTLESHFNECIDWLKSIKNRVQPEQEWSEEDEIGLGDTLWAIKQARTIAKDENDMGNLWYAEKWLKSLRPQNTWKPSEEEIEKASQEWESKAIFNPFYMTMDGDKPTGVTQDITTHKESFKAGVKWILKKIGF